MIANPGGKESLLTLLPKNFNSRGFTLLEIMVVVGIMAAIVGLILPRIDNKNNQIKSEMRRMTTLTRQIRNLAKLQNSTFRLVLDLKSGPESVEPHQYWVEKATGEFLIAEDREEAFKERMAEESESTSEKAPPVNDFTKDESIIKEAKSLPQGMIFENIELAGFDQPVAEGKVYIHFFPSGLVEEVAIHLKLGENQWTMATHPLTGKSDIVSKYISLKEIKDQ